MKQIERWPTSEIPHDITALLITTERSEWVDIFVKAFNNFGTIETVNLKNASRIPPKKYEIIFVACKGKAPKETLYPSLRKIFKDALIISAPSMLPSTEEKDDYLMKRPDGHGLTDDVWCLSFDPKIITEDLIVVAMAIRIKRLRKIRQRFTP